MNVSRNEIAAFQSSTDSIVWETQQQPIGYSSLEDRKSAGAHYTPKMLADFVAEEILRAWPQTSQSGQIHVLDPATGDGELLLSILEGLSGRDYLNVEAVGFDTDPGSIESATARIKHSFPHIPLHLREEDFLNFALLYGGNDLFGTLVEPFDLIIANPPYVRTQVMGAEKAQLLARQFGLSGRVDLCYAFILGIARLLRPGGIAGIIVSNRFMTTHAGACIRKSIIEEFDILHVWDLGDTRLFEAAVLPAVLLVKRKNDEQPPESKFTSIYLTEDTSPAHHCVNITQALDKSGIVELGNGQRYLVQHGRLEHGEHPEGVWRMATEASDKWLDMVRTNTFCTFGDIGKIRVGVKTTADQVFIRSDWDDLPTEERPELLRPLITHHVARPFKAIQPTKRILYTHQIVRGKRTAVNLDEFPRAARYLGRHRSILEQREYVLKAGRKWFEIWVPHNPDIWAQPKIVFRDITEKPTFWMDLSGAVVNGDCYWLACNQPQQTDLLWLALAVGNSSFIVKFYDHRFHNKLYAGRRRFMTQYVEKFPLPNPGTELSRQIIHLTKEIYDLVPSPRATELKTELDQLVWQAFGVAGQSISPQG